MLDQRNIVGRRDLLKGFGSGLLVLLAFDDFAPAQESGGAHRRNGSEHPVPTTVSAWIHIDTSGHITAYTGKTEVGQNIRTSLTQAIADELRCDAAAVSLVMADTALTPYDFGTVGSRTTPSMAPQLRAMAAAAREQMILTAARKWNLDTAGLNVSDGVVSTKNWEQKASFGELASSVDWVKVVGREDLLTPVQKRQQSGKSLVKINAADFVTGKHRYSSDTKRPGVRYGQILRPSSFGAKLKSLDSSAVANMPGVTVVHEGDFAGVVAPDEFSAQKAISALKAKWEEQPQISAAGLYEYLKANPTETDPSRKAGEVSETDKAVPDPADKTLQASYQVAYIAHVPLEPRAAIAEWNGAKVTIWTGSQRPFGVRSELADAFHIAEEDVRVIVPDTGSAYGGKHTGECAIEAARLAKAAGKPVKLIWTREEEFTWAYFRPAGVIEVRGCVTRDGTLSAWDFVNYNSGPSGLESPYKSANSNVHFQPTKYPLRQGSYRGLAATANHFARESFIDELAIAAGIDPLAFRLKNLNQERVQAVLKAAAQRFEWSNGKASAGRGRGLSCGMEKGGFFACCVEISVAPDKNIRVERVVEAFECGTIINPEHLKNQIEGAIVMGLGGALFEAIDFANGRILNPHLAQYRVPRFKDVPPIDVVLVDRKNLPSAGAGETPIMGIAPAIGNALFQATGVRVRSMPILPAFRKA